MFKYWSIKKYGTRLLPALEKRYGKHPTYTARQIRATVFQKNFNPKHLALGYLLFLDPKALNETLLNELPELDIEDYIEELSEYLDTKNYPGQLEKLQKLAS